MTDITLPDNQTNMEMSEGAKIQVKDTMKSKFGLLSEEVVLPINLQTLPQPEEMPEDLMFRTEVDHVLPGILEQEGNVLVILNIATQHAIATAPVFLEAGLDVYYAFTPEDQQIRPSHMRGSYYHPKRVVSVALANKERIRKAKERLEKDKLRGVVITIDPHASFEIENGDFDRFLPEEELLRELGISRIVFMGEFAPASAQGLTERRIDKKPDWDKSPIYEYMRQMKLRGYPIALVGIDTRE